MFHSPVQLIVRFKCNNFNVFFSRRVCELWCGESHGNISIFTIRENIVTSQEVVNHYDPIIDNLDVLHLTSSHCPVYDNRDMSVWSYVYPGEVVLGINIQYSLLCSTVLCLYWPLDEAKLLSCSLFVSMTGFIQTKE